MSPNSRGDMRLQRSGDVKSNSSVWTNLIRARECRDISAVSKLAVALAVPTGPCCVTPPPVPTSPTNLSQTAAKNDYAFWHGTMPKSASMRYPHPRQETVPQVTTAQP